MPDRAVCARSERLWCAERKLIIVDVREFAEVLERPPSILPAPSGFRPRAQHGFAMRVKWSEYDAGCRWMGCLGLATLP